MYTTYNLFKFIHVLAAIIWIGGAFTNSILYLRLLRQDDRTGLAAFSRQGSFFHTRIHGPAAGTTLLAGIAMLVVEGAHTVPFWILWGLGVILVTAVSGAIFLRRAAEALGQRMATTQGSDPQILSLRRRVTTLSVMNLTLLVSALWAMVFKPTL